MNAFMVLALFGLATLSETPACADSTSTVIESTWTSEVAQAAGLPSEVHQAFFPAVGVEKVRVIFFHGHADQVLNHAAFFADLQKNGVSIVGFDFPQHGKSKLGALDLWPFDSLLKLSFELIQRTARETPAPLALMGWSFGGLVLTRLLQDYGTRPEAQEIFKRTHHAIYLVPALTPQYMTGGDGLIRIETLTQNTDSEGRNPPSFLTALQTPFFAIRLIFESFKARLLPFPKGVSPSFVFSDAQEDRYVDVEALEAHLKQAVEASTPRLYCRYARHALSFEPTPYRQEIQKWILKQLNLNPLEEQKPFDSKNAFDPEPALCASELRSNPT